MMEEKIDNINSAEICAMLKEFCERNGLEVHENKHGVSAKNADNSELFVYAEPKRIFGPNVVTLVYGQIYRSDRPCMWLTQPDAKYLYKKLIEKLGLNDN